MATSTSKPKGSGLVRKPVLVVGASGQLGTRVVQQLAKARVPVRAFVRPTSRHEHLLRLASQGVQVVHGDLTEPSSVMAACHGAGAIIATANAVAPTHGSSFKRVDDEGYVNLIGAARKQGCGRFVLISVPVTPHDAKVPLFRCKRLTEQRLVASGHEHCILRAGPFMDDWFVFIGSRLPARGDDAALITRRWGFLQTFIGVVGNLIDQRGIALVPGSAATRHAFVTIDDVAAALLVATTHPEARNATLELAGPELLSWGQVAGIYAKVLQRPVQTVSTPAFVFRLQQLLMRPFSEAASNIMALNWLAAHGMPMNDTGTADRFGLRLTTAEQFLRAKATLPA